MATYVADASPQTKELPSYEYAPPPVNPPSFYPSPPQLGNPQVVYSYPPPPSNPPPMIHYVQAQEIHLIRDWLAWSIINIFVCCLLGGVVALIFSILCRSKKRANDVQGARTMGTIALVVNIISTLVGVAVWIIIIVMIVRSTQAVRDIYSYPYK